MGLKEKFKGICPPKFTVGRVRDARADWMPTSLADNVELLRSTRGVLT